MNTSGRKALAISILALGLIGVGLGLAAGYGMNPMATTKVHNIEGVSDETSPQEPTEPTATPTPPETPSVQGAAQQPGWGQAPTPTPQTTSQSAPAQGVGGATAPPAKRLVYSEPNCEAHNYTWYWSDGSATSEDHPSSNNAGVCVSN